MQEKNILKTPVRYIKGVGPRKGEYLTRLGIHTVEDILYYLPTRYDDRSRFTSIKELKVGEHQTVQGEIITLSSRLTKTGMPIFQIAITDQIGFIHAVWFNQPYLKDYLRKGQRVIIYGKVEMYDKLQIVQPEYEVLKTGEKDSINIGRIVPVYSLTGQLTQRYLRSLAFLAIMNYSKSLIERLPSYLIARAKVVDIKFAVRNIHFPVSFDNLEKAYRRIVFEEFFMLQLALAIKKKDVKFEESAFTFSLAGGLIDSFTKTIPFELTEGQKKAVSDIERDLSSGRPMNRLIEGDVGSGKTVVASYALVLAVQNGFQGVLMAPTEVLARQHFIGLSELLMPLGINIVLLIHGIDPKMRDKIYSEIREGRINIVVGTHAIIQEAVEFKRLGLVVIDEQHKFGVTQRAALRQKGYNPHVLVMTATPIPRTLALTVYGDLDISIIKEMPKGRRPITTYLVEEEKRGEVYNFIKEELNKGRQAYVVCPLIEKGAGYRVKGVGAEEVYEKLKSDVFPDYEVGLLHGRMSSREKEKVMKDFKKGKIKVLVSTIVIEVGIDIPNATVMLIENAERFGLAQLHQLRGRVGRGGHESYCILLANPRTEEARDRLKALEETLDGFQIAEADLNIRGPGEFFGTRQHGLPEIRFGNILKDFDIMEVARKEAFGLIAKDPNLAEEHHKLLKENLLSRFKGRLDLIKVG
ncbi:MAG: ATP-dependent DNA helicase RecG [Candidatus Omnitrophica bacterium]|nr:ATP-dependent DNA helicase RecG [Candidatus Omnitrophota bacterium]